MLSNQRLCAPSQYPYPATGEGDASTAGEEALCVYSFTEIGVIQGFCRSRKSGHADRRYRHFGRSLAKILPIEHIARVSGC